MSHTCPILVQRWLWSAPGSPETAETMECKYFLMHQVLFCIFIYIYIVFFIFYGRQLPLWDSKGHSFSSIFSSPQWKMVLNFVFTYVWSFSLYVFFYDIWITAAFLVFFYSFLATPSSSSFVRGSLSVHSKFSINSVFNKKETENHYRGKKHSFVLNFLGTCTGHYHDVWTMTKTCRTQE